VRAIHVVVPDGIDDPARPSGGNTYDRHLCRELAAIGWSVHEHAVPGFWTRPDSAAFAALQGELERIPDSAAVLLDGLIASTAPDVLVAQARRLHTVVLVHMPLGHRPPDGCAEGVRRREGMVLRAAASVVVTSEWACHRLVELYGLPTHRVHVAEPGVDPAELARGTPAGGAFLCVATVTFEKGHDVLLDALCSISDLTWRCVCVGRLDREPEFVDGLRHRIAEGVVRDRVSLRGPRAGADLDREYLSADLLVLASRAETYGMVVSEALARGVPVVAAEVGGLSEALGNGPDNVRPGLLVPPEDPVAFGAALRTWLCDPELRTQLRRAARERRVELPRWTAAASVVAGVLTAAAR
jgi:glycosyltransferase involved in cell wall biosynthesis